MVLLPQQIMPVLRSHITLTERCFGRDIEAVLRYFLALRAEADSALASRLAPAGGKPYPYGRCEEITREVFARLRQRVERPAHPIDSRIRDFVAAGGAVRTVWGVLRGQYFQNALQLGALYVDVSNDTVVVTKPKVEILPMEDSGLEPVRDLAHFRAVAETYWGAAIAANHMAPSLAPLLPLVSHSPGRLPAALHSACDYMIALMCRDAFREAEAWLAEAAEPEAAPAIAVAAGIPQDLRPWTADARAEAVEACRRARAAGCHTDPRWRDARVLDFLRIRTGAAGGATPAEMRP